MVGSARTIASTKVCAKRDTWGQKLERKGGFYWRVVSPIQFDELTQDPVRQTVLDLGMGFSPMSRTIALKRSGLELGEVKIKPADYDRLIKKAGQAAHSSVRALVTSQKFRDTPREGQRIAIRTAVARHRNAAITELRAKLILEGELDLTVDLDKL